MYRVYLLLGSNRGDRLKSLLLARYWLQVLAGGVVRTSHVYVTEPWGKTNQPRYLNQAVEILTDKPAFQLLRILHRIEKKLGRTNKHHYSARVIDIDILFYDDLILHSKHLTIPHPRLHLRNFTLQPMTEIAKSYTHPILKSSIEELAKICEDTGKVSIFNPLTP